MFFYYFGTFELLKKGSFKIRGDQAIKLKIGKPINTKNYDYSKRRKLAEIVQKEVLNLSK